jgi:8-oxo-dGTP pyrophosphatase MutT (NUDIX family)
VSVRVTLPPQLVEQARAFTDSPRTPVEPRDAATVVLMRPGHGAPEVYLLRRQSSMAFAGGMCVFPGGGVDQRDFDHSVAWAGPPPATWAERLGASQELARALVCAAVRETFEESGVLLAGPSPDRVVADTTDADWEADRLALEGKELSFTEFLDRRGLVLRTDLLGAWSGWCTPVFEPRRFRARFFVAVLPAGQRTRDVSTESSSVTWLDAGQACDLVDSGDMGMLPPTYLTCLEVAQHGTPDEVLAAARDRRVEIFTPELEGSGADATLSAPAHLAPLVEARRA